MKKYIKKIIINMNLINIFSFPFYFCRIFKIKQNKIACTNFSGKGYGDNPKYIVEELLKMPGKYDIVWFVKDIKKEKNKFPDGIRLAKIYSLKYYYEMSTSKIWINNSRFPLFVRKRKQQYYIQTWHGGLGLKKIEKDAINNLSDYYKKSAPHDSQMINLAVSNSKYRSDLFKKSFWYNGEIFEVGCPRNDIFFINEKKKNIIHNIKKQYNINEDKKIILYAPTFRINSNFDYFSIDIDRLLGNLNNNYNDKYIFLLKLHPRLAGKYNIQKKNIIDVTNYPDVDELLLICDILISDYSSVLFDFLYTGNPVYLYSPDYEEYIGERGLNFVYEDLPFPIAYNSDELINNIVNNKSKDYEFSLKEFLKEMELKDDGNASKKIVEIINKEIEGGVK